MPCEAARSAERRLASLLAVKWDRQYSEMVNFIRTRMSLSVVRSNTLLLRKATSLLVESLVSNSQLDNEAHLGCVRGAGNAGRRQGLRMERRWWRIYHNRGAQGAEAA
eukprot:CCRYP_011265-RA/>CCRYP_011265-RA protein AED:0.45 eAED:0.45 QI:0/0/0/1/1/1/2/0/107